MPLFSKFIPDIHSIRPHKGQMATALRLRSLLHSEANPSQIAGNLYAEKIVFLLQKLVPSSLSVLFASIMPSLFALFYFSLSIVLVLIVA